MQIDLNADMGEGFGAYRIGHDDELLGIVTSANVACGFHGGDPLIMRRLAATAAEKGVGLGAHPGFNDLWGFGRREIHMNAGDLECLVAYQIGALMALAAYSACRVRHVKAHGALYNMAAKDEGYARALARAVKTVGPEMIFVGPPGSELEKAAAHCGLAFAGEGFCDRVYNDDGSLMARSIPGSVLSDPEAAARQALRLARDGEVVTASGKRLALKVDTLCVHGDEPSAVAVAKAVRSALAAASISLTPMAGDPR